MRVVMKVLKAYTIPFTGLKIGEHHFDFDIDNTFFQSFEYDEFNAVDIKIDLNFEKKTTFLELFFSATGTVNINCDLTNEPYNQFIDDEFKLVIKFGEAYNNDNEDILIVPHGSMKLT